jgi:hypothetical protein
MPRERKTDKCTRMTTLSLSRCNTPLSDWKRRGDEKGEERDSGKFLRVVVRENQGAGRAQQRCRNIQAVFAVRKVRRWALISTSDMPLFHSHPDPIQGERGGCRNRAGFQSVARPHTRAYYMQFTSFPDQEASCCCCHPEPFPGLIRLSFLFVPSNYQSRY